MTFLYTYYHAWRKIDLLEEEEDNPEHKDYQFIDLEDLPGIVSKKWIEKKRRMLETIARVNGEPVSPDGEEKELDNEDSEEESPAGGDDEDIEYDEFGNPVPLERFPEPEGRPSATTQIKAAVMKVVDRTVNSLKPDSQKALTAVKTIPRTTRPKLTTKGLYSEDPYALAGVLERSQLQRMLSEDRALRVLLGTGNALEVIRRFKQMPSSDEQNAALEQLDGGSAADGRSIDDGGSASGSSSYDDSDDLDNLHDDLAAAPVSQPIGQLQELIFARLDKLEKGSLDVDQVEVPQVKFLSGQLSDVLSDVQNCWREGIISVLESATSISSALLQLTKGVEDVSVNHNAIMEALCVDESSSESDMSPSYLGSRTASKSSMY